MLKIKPGDKITLKVNPGKNSFRSGYNVLKTDFEKSRAFIQRDSGRDELPATPFWVTFDVIENVFLKEDQLYWLHSGQERVNGIGEPLLDTEMSKLLTNAIAATGVLSTPVLKSENYWLPRLQSNIPPEPSSVETLNFE